MTTACGFAQALGFVGPFNGREPLREAASGQGL
jgi:hypothetical protein